MFIENHDNFFGYGGAIFTEKGSITVFKARTVMQNNKGASGGALYNVGTTILETGAFFGDNQATVRKHLCKLAASPRS